jgi:hypothetical protein
MSAGKSNRQVRIGDSGELEEQPVTWDGEPMHSAATIPEGLFDATPFEQIPGQLSIEGSNDGE